MQAGSVYLGKAEEGGRREESERDVTVKEWFQRCYNVTFEDG